MDKKTIEKIQNRLNKRIKKRLEEHMKKKKKWANLVLNPPKIEHYKTNPYDGYLGEKKIESARRNRGIGLGIKQVPSIKPKERK